MRRRLQFDKIVHAKIKQYIIISRFIALQSRFENAHGRSQFFLIFCSVALALSLFLCTSFDRLCVEAFSLDFDVYTMTPPNRAVFHASWNSMLFFLVERHESVARWCFFSTNNLMSLSEARSARIRRPTIYTVLNYGFGIWRKLQSSDRNRNNIHNIQTIQNASNQCLLITIFLFRLLQFNYKSNTNKLVGQT